MTNQLTPRQFNWTELSDFAHARTPARILAGRAGSSYRTPTLLGLRGDHAAARDAIAAEIDLDRDLGIELIQRLGLFEVQTRAAAKAEYLLRPDLGRRLSDAGRAAIAAHCPTGAELQVVIGDGLSATAVAAQAPALLPLLWEGACARGYGVGRPFLVRYCRVGILNDVGELLQPAVVVLLIGERPGLATAEGLSAYMAFQPRPGDTDAQRNLISNIHSRGVSPAAAATRILALAARMRQLGVSGVAVKEELPALAGDPLAPRLNG